MQTAKHSKEESVWARGSASIWDLLAYFRGLAGAALGAGVVMACSVASGQGCYSNIAPYYQTADISSMIHIAITNDVASLKTTANPASPVKLPSGNLNSHVSIISVSQTPPHGITFVPAPGWDYRLQFRNSLSTGQWEYSNDTTFVPAAGGVPSLVDTNLSPQQFCRISAQRE